MGSGASTGNNSILEDMQMPLDASDVKTPRGVSAIEEVKRLRLLLQERDQQTTSMLAKTRFDEMDHDKNGFLENKELQQVVQWVMQTFGDSLGSDPEVIKTRMMQRLDANKDGKLDPDEFKQLFTMILQRVSLMQKAEAKFREFDSDSSGFLELNEIDAVITWTLKAFPEGESYDSYKIKLITEIDANGDGKLDMAEFLKLFEDMLARIDLIKRAKTKFDELDTDKSGMLEAAELEKVAEWVLSAYVEKSEADRAAFKTTLIKRMDANGDGKLSLQEFAIMFDEMLLRMDLIKRAKIAFDKLDADKSGFLEKSELIPVVSAWATAVNQAIGVDPSKQLDELLASTDANSDGKIELLEFVVIFEQCIASSGVWN